MSDTWRGKPDPAPPGLSLPDWLRVVRRGVPIVLLLGAGFAVLLLLRLMERVLGRGARMASPHVTRIVCRLICRLIGLGRRQNGHPMAGPGACVSNHVSWLDILVLNAGAPLRFVAKSEVAAWPGIGLLARGTGTVFVARKRGDARAHATLLASQLRPAPPLMIFPEGTTTDGLRVLAFKPTLFEAFYAPEGPQAPPQAPPQTTAQSQHVQPVTLRYTAPPGMRPDFYGWWGDISIGAGLLAVLSHPRQGRVEVTYHEPLRVADHANRKALALAAETAVRAPLMTGPEPPGA